MKTGKNGKDAAPDVPVDPARLRREFPDLSEADLDAYVTVTRQVMADPLQRAARIREAMQAAEQARVKTARGESPGPNEALALRYVTALEKMQKKPQKPS